MIENISLSFWEQQSYFEGVDLLIVGAGIVGLNAARAAKELKPNWKILVVDRGAFLPYGASTRNAGFACFGSMTELMDDLKSNSEDQVFSLVEKRWKGLLKLRSVLGDENIGYEERGGYELFAEMEDLLFDSCFDEMEKFNAHLKSLTGIENVYQIASPQIKEFGFHGIKHLIKNKAEGQIDTGKMMKSLLALVRSLGVEVLNGIEIKSWQEKENYLLVETGNGFAIPVQQMLITTNAFAKQLLPDLNVQPGRAQVLITSHIENLKVKGTFHVDKGYYYFRNVGDRLLLGGGRNLDFAGEKTYDFGITENIQSHLQEMLKNTILPNQKFDIEQRWSGIMGLGPNKTTIVKKVEERIGCAVRMGGMGIAIGTLIGEEAAGLMI